MLFGNLGNLRQPGNNDSSNAGSNNVLDNTPTSARMSLSRSMAKLHQRNGNVVKKNEHEPEKPVSLCRALSTRMDPEELKILGNEDYKNGRFAEAVALYDAAISINQIRPLIEATRVQRSSGEAEKAVYHFKQSGPEADPDAMNNAKTVQIHLNKCTDAKRRGDWNGVLRETSLSIEAGADSAPWREEAIQTMQNCPNFDMDDCTKFFGPIGSASVLVYRAQFNLVTGRLSYDPYNAVLLCNRAACKTKLGQYQKALDDCNAALNARPNYNGEMGCMFQDCEVLLRESPDDEEVQKLLEEAKTNLQKHGGSLDTNVDNSPSTSIVVVKNVSETM
ncbi:TPR repeat-containing thioredoxin TTL2 [Sesamum angolense]|uniref:TPR repeat-containing thioredoxin TTL2 n=1 Tax=Sesamum angolense TaxID=2727404 RepID=A0AAE1T5K9_9LAMI|nr:TPR repeat-containing thioredoxin TTL2 [Sesamum angolense]